MSATVCIMRRQCDGAEAAGSAEPSGLSDTSLKPDHLGFLQTILVMTVYCLGYCTFRLVLTRSLGSCFAKNSRCAASVSIDSFLVESFVILLQAMPLVIVARLTWFVQHNGGGVPNIARFQADDSKYWE